MAEIIKGYTILRELMRNGQRVTVLARETASARRVVVKALTLPLGEGEAQAARVRHKAVIERSQKLTGEEFLPLLSCGEEEGKLYLIREHAEGWTLSQVLEAVKQFPVELAGLLFEAIAQAVQKAHLQGIAHLALSAGNVIFRKDGKLVFTDWVKELESASPGPGREKVQRVQHQADQNLDLFAMGVLFAKVLVGEPDLDPKASDAEIVVHLSQRLRGETTIPERMAKIVYKLLGEEFERYDGAAEVLADLKEYVKGLGDFDPREAWQRFLAGPEAFVKQLNQWKAGQIAIEAKELLLAGKVKEARAGFEKALALDPDNSQAEAELELLGAREGSLVEKAEALPKPVAKPKRPGIFSKLRAAETPEVPVIPPSQPESGIASTPPIPEAGEEVPPFQEEPMPQQKSGITTGLDWEQIIATSPRPLSEEGPPTSKEPEPIASEAVAEAPVEQVLTLEPVIEKPLEEGEEGGIGFNEETPPLAGEATQEALGEGMGAPAMSSPAPKSSQPRLAKEDRGSGHGWPLSYWGS